MEAVLLPIVGILINSILILLFYTKKHINNEETKIYSKLVLFNSIFLALGLIAFVIAKATGNITAIMIIQKIYMSILVILNYLSVKYCFTIFNINFKMKNFKKITFIITSIFIMLILILPLNVIYYDNVLDGNGLSYDVTLIYVIISFIIFLGITIHIIVRKESITKVIPFLILIFLYLVGLVIRSIYKELIFEGFFYSYILLVMYHTIENPDVKLLNEYIKNKELAELNIEDKANMLFKISQDVKLPISKIELYSSQLLNHSELNDSKDSIKNINSLSRDVSKMINNVLDISNIEMSNAKITDISYNTYNIFNQIILLTSKNIKSNIEFKYNISSLLPDNLYGDSLKIKQVIYSILMNSIKNTQEGCIDLDVSAIIRYDVCRLMITINDTAPNMTLNQINSILDNNNLLNKEIEKINDLDVDLRIVKKIVDILGGTLLIKSEEHGGNTYTFIINQKIENKDTKNNDIIKKLSLKLSNKKKILILDDNYKELELLSIEFKKNNYNVLTTIYWKDCLNKIENNKDINLLFIDDEMEEKNAVEVIKLIDTSKIKTIIMLDQSKEPIKKHYLEDYPFNDYLLKDNYKEEIRRIKNNKYN